MGYPLATHQVSPLRTYTLVSTHLPGDPSFPHDAQLSLSPPLGSGHHLISPQLPNHNPPPYKIKLTSSATSLKGPFPFWSLPET